MQRCWFVMLVILIAVPGLAIQSRQHASKSETAELSTALRNLQEQPHDPAVQKRYLDAFPHTYRAFLGFFDLGSPLYDGNEYILLLPSLAAQHEAALGQLLVDLSKDAKYEADAPGYLQHITAEYGSRYTKSFVRLLRQLPTKERSHLVIFLAEVENHSAYPEYQTIIVNLKSLGQSGLAYQFERARKTRSAQPHF